MGTKKINFELEPILYEALLSIVDIEGYSSFSEYFRDCIRSDARNLGFFDKQRAKEILDEHAKKQEEGDCEIIEDTEEVPATC